MIITQAKNEFNPINITLETVEEADAFRDLLLSVDAPKGSRERQMMITIENLFSDMTLEVQCDHDEVTRVNLDDRN